MGMDRRKFMGQMLGVCSAGACLGLAKASTAVNEQWEAILNEHTLAAIETDTVQIRWPRQAGRNAQLGIHGHGPKQGICRITTDRGASGWGVFGGGQKAAQPLLDKYKGVRLTKLFDTAVGVIDNGVLPLDFALHDLAGQILGIPVYRMMGAAKPAVIPCYSGMIYFDDLDPEDNPAGIKKVLENCQADIEIGYRQLKVKIGRGYKWMPVKDGLQRDIEVTLAIAKEFPEIEILVDANNGFTHEHTIQYLDALGDLDLFWMEEPFHENREGFLMLREWLTSHGKKTYIADGEARPDQKLLLELAREKLLDVHLTDIVGYGFTKWRKLMPVLKDIGVLTSPHAWGSGIKTNYITHIATGLGNVVTIEGVTSACEQVDLSRYKLKDGKITPPELPGFGMKLKV